MRTAEISRNVGQKAMVEEDIKVAVPSALDSLLVDTVNKAVADAMTNAVSKAIADATADAVNKAIADATADAVNKAIADAMANAKKAEMDSKAAVARAIAIAKKTEEDVDEALKMMERRLREKGHNGGVYHQQECPICLDFLSSYRCSILPCYHMLHTVCWMSTSRRSCPVCRAGSG